MQEACHLSPNCRIQHSRLSQRLSSAEVLSWMAILPTPVKRMCFCGVSAKAGYTRTKLQEVTQLGTVSHRLSITGILNKSCWELLYLLRSMPPVSLSFLVAVIHKFSPQALANPCTVGPGFIQRSPEVQFQDEFYHCLRMYFWGSFTTFPEYGTKSGWVDFYIPSKQWAIELLHDGDRLEEHSS